MDIKDKNIKIVIALLLLFLVFALINWLFLKKDGKETLDERVPEVKDISIDAYQVKNGKIHYRQVGNLREVEGADPETFQALDNDYAKDANNVYFRNFPIEEAKSDTFEVVDELWSKDDENVFCSRVSVHKKIVESADPETFEAVGSGYYKDKDNVFKDCHISEIPNLDPQTFEIVDENTVKDKNGTYNME